MDIAKAPSKPCRPKAQHNKRPALRGWLGLCLLGLACPKAEVTPRPPTKAPASRAPQAELLAGAAFHTVEKGQTLYGISRHYGVPLPQLLAANQMRETDVLHIGQRLRIPGAASASPPPGALGASPPPGKVATKPPPPGVEKLRLEWPVKGMLYAKFGKKGQEVHDGIDLAAPLGTPVRAAAAGKVLYAGEQKGYGRIVIVEHSAGVVTLYAHNHELHTQTGAEVAAGAVIATVGKSGRTSGPHLHFELRLNGIPVDPLPYFKSPP